MVLPSPSDPWLVFCPGFTARQRVGIPWVSNGHVESCEGVRRFVLIEHNIAWEWRRQIR